MCGANTRHLPWLQIGTRHVREDASGGQARVISRKEEFGPRRQHPLSALGLLLPPNPQATGRRRPQVSQPHRQRLRGR